MDGQGGARSNDRDGAGGASKAWRVADATLWRSGGQGGEAGLAGVQEVPAEAGVRWQPGSKPVGPCGGVSRTWGHVGSPAARYPSSRSVSHPSGLGRLGHTVAGSGSAVAPLAQNCQGRQSSPVRPSQGQYPKATARAAQESPSPRRQAGAAVLMACGRCEPPARAAEWGSSGSLAGSSPGRGMCQARAGGQVGIR